MPFTASDICKIILAIILPPLGVFLERGCGADFLINILLTILGYIPGIIHALYVSLGYASSPTYPAPWPSISEQSKQNNATAPQTFQRLTMVGFQVYYSKVLITVVRGKTRVH
ncbi:hypothetical protein F5Y08DRAFT_267947 [Xylaria arbuscula]|nr:hypothetical protein F5Y08DRAFT_267947 [Xylaria arbuscula]